MPVELDGETPWMVFDAIEWLERNLQKGMRVFEWGCGGSTVFLARRVAHVTSVEHTPLWHDKVQGLLWERSLMNVTLLLRPPEPGRLQGYGSIRKAFADFNFKAYVSEIDKVADASLDLVVVDGRARNACIRQALPKVKVGGYLVLDNADRSSYAEGLRRLAKWKTTLFEGHGPGSHLEWATLAARKVET